MQEKNSPTLQQILSGYRSFNEWEISERQEELRRLNVPESLRRYFELCSMVRPWRPDASAEEKLIEHAQSLWIALRQRLEQEP